MLFLQFLLFFLPAISVFRHYGSTQIVCPPVVSFFQPQRTPTASCLHFLFKKNVHIPSKRPPLSLLTLLLLAGDINPNPGPPDCINFSFANVRSLSNKYSSIQKFILDNNTDVFAMSETWIRPDASQSYLSDISPQGHTLFHRPRESRRGGGVAFLVKNELQTSRIPTDTYSSFENLLIKISLQNKSCLFLNIYKPPSTSPATFYEQFNALLENIYPTTDNLVIIGEFNIHMDTNSNDSKKFRALLGSFDLLQKVNFPTHILGHTIDLVLTKSRNDNISHVHATEAFSDHFSITFKVNITPQRQISGDTVTFRKYHKINMEAMRKDLLSSELIVDPKNNSDALYSQYHSTLTTLIDKHVPSITKHVRSKYIPGWVNDSVI